MTTRQSRSISTLLVAAVLFMTVLPAHFHLHHTDAQGENDTHSHEHVVDMHIYTSDMDLAHHEDAQLLKTSPDSLLKSLSIKFTPFILFGMLLAVLSLVLYRVTRRLVRQLFLPARHTYLRSTPLRGPPVLN